MNENLIPTQCYRERQPPGASDDFHVSYFYIIFSSQWFSSALGDRMLLCWAFIDVGFEATHESLLIQDQHVFIKPQKRGNLSFSRQLRESKAYCERVKQNSSGLPHSTSLLLWLCFRFCTYSPTCRMVRERKLEAVLVRGWEKIDRTMTSFAG